MGILDGIEIFALTVEAGSFAAAARRLGVTASAVSRRVANLEEQLGVPLLARTTRSLSLTHDGQSFHERCVRILEELGEARDALAHVRKRPSGTIRVDAPIALGRAMIAPRLPEFLSRYPDVSVDLTLRDQFVDPFVEGLDVLLRVGALGDSTLIARRLGESRLVVCGSPAYLKRRGMPKTPRDLSRHECLCYLRGGRPQPWRIREGGVLHEVVVRGRYNSSDVDVILRGALAGQGLVLLLDFLVADAFRAGTLVRVLADYDSTARPIHALYPKNRHLVPKVGAFLDFAAALFASSRRTPARARSS